jgi:hypothetical protein
MVTFKKPKQLNKKKVFYTKFAVGCQSFPQKAGTVPLGDRK